MGPHSTHPVFSLWPFYGETFSVRPKPQTLNESIQPSSFPLVFPNGVIVGTDSVSNMATASSLTAVQKQKQQ